MARVFQVSERAPGDAAGTGQFGRLTGVRPAAAGPFALLLLLGSFTLAITAPAREKPPKPAQLKISGYGVLGNRELKRVLRTLELGGKKPPFFSADFVEDAALILSSHIKGDGYLRPAIRIHLLLADGSQMRVQVDELIENPLPRPLRIKRVQVRIRKGVLYHFQPLEFKGLESIATKQARSYFVETEILLNVKRARIYTPERLRRGVSSLQDLLDRQGYQNAQVNAAELSRDDKTGAVSVRIDVRQGQKSIVRSVREEFSYADGAQPPRVESVFPRKPFSKLWLQDFTHSLKTNLYHQGYPDASVKVRTVKIQPERDRVLLDLAASVDSGPRVRIGQVVFQGAKRTRPSLMSRRARVRRGEWLDRIKVEDGRARLAQLGIFDTVELSYKPVDAHARDVVYELKEGRNRDLSLLFGWGSYEMLRGGFEFEEFNIWGSAHHARIRAVQSMKSSSGDFTYTVPELVGRDTDLFVNGSALRREEVSFTRVEYGGGIGLHKYFQPQATDAAIRYNYQILNALEFHQVQAVAAEGLTNPAVGSVILDVKHDRRDSPLYPRSGYKVFSTIETATSYLGGDANYERIDISPSWHHRLGGGRYFSLGVSHGVAVSFGSPANNLPFNRRFFPGGGNSIRGYQEGEASPRNARGQIVGAETYTLATVELEQALTPQWSIVLFSDSLGFAHRIADYPFDTGLFSVGGGVRWRTLIGPIRLEYGYNLNPRKQDPSGTLQFSLGYPF